jgi:hypothetical protein
MMKYEGSKADKIEDKKGAKRTGMTLKQWEKSPQDRKQDVAGTKRERARKAKKKKALAK